MRVRRVMTALMTLALLGLPSLGASGFPGTANAPEPRTFVFGGEGNRLWAFDAETGEAQVVIRSADDGEAGTYPGKLARDINAQICVNDAGTHFIAGEDTEQGASGSPGWGWFALDASDPDDLDAVQLGKLVPTWSGSSSNPENYGCGFLPNGDLVTSDVGDQLPHEEASGQLIVWFADENGGFADGLLNTEDTNYCKVDTDLGTAGGIWVTDDSVLVASNRPGPDGPGGIYRYPISQLPTDETCNGTNDRHADLVNEGTVTKEPWLPNDAWATTPSALVPSGELFGMPTYYVSSVFTGVIAEYVDTGAARVHLRNVVEPPAGAPIGQLDDLPGNDAGTPFGLGVGPDGDLWYADLGIQGTGPVDGKGSFQRVGFDANGNATQRTVVLDGLNFPDGIGIATVPVGGPPPQLDGGGCGWSMYGQNPARTFSLEDECESPITRDTVATLVPKWAFKTPATVTASPVARDGKVYVGDWTGTMYALDADTGDVVWQTAVDLAPGAAFGPIVSSAAATAPLKVEAELPSGFRHAPLVIFGAGPVLYALDAVDGTEVWRHVLDSREGTPVEIESSPVVVGDVVYVGTGNHNKRNTGHPGSLLAVSTFDGTFLGKFEPELGQDQGCGTVWSSPVIDTRDDRAYIATGNCDASASVYTWTPHTEAVTALDIAVTKSGSRTTSVDFTPAWSFQSDEHPPYNGADHDYGATPNLFQLPSGRKVVGAGNKNGHYYVLDAANGGLLHDVEVGDDGSVSGGFAIGGFLGSPAVYRGQMYGGTAIPTPPEVDGSMPFAQTLEGIYASVDASSGAITWRAAQAPTYAASAAVNGVVFHGALDNVFRAYDTESGVVRWAAPLFGPISSGAAVDGDSVYVGSGTSSSDACVKEAGEQINGLCLAAFDGVLGSTGGVHAFQLATSALP